MLRVINYDALSWRTPSQLPHRPTVMLKLVTDSLTLLWCCVLYVMIALSELLRHAIVNAYWSRTVGSRAIWNASSPVINVPIMVNDTHTRRRRRMYIALATAIGTYLCWLGGRKTMCLEWITVWSRPRAHATQSWLVQTFSFFSNGRRRKHTCEAVVSILTCRTDVMEFFIRLMMHQ